MSIVSVIVPTLNSGRSITGCLKSILNQTYKELDIVIVDGGSTDDTMNIAHKYGIRVIRSNRRGITHQRNMGALNSRGEFLLHIDSDEILHPKLIEECVDKAINGGFDAAFVPTIDTGTSYIGRARCVGDIINLRFRHELRTPNSPLRFCSKKVFRDTGGHDENLVVGEDLIFGLECIERGFKIFRCRYPIFHFGVEGLRNIFLKKYTYGKTIRALYAYKAKKFGYSIAEERTNVGIFYLKYMNKVRIICGRYIMGFFIVKSVENLGLLMGYIISTEI